MVILEEPYVSEMLLNYLKESGIPVLENEYVLARRPDGLNLKPSSELVAHYADSRKIYTVSENALNWVNSTLDDKDLNRQVGLLKDKTAFREACRELYPGFFFREITYAELFDFDVSSVKYPFVLKPSVGFLSLGVYTVFDENDWKDALADLKSNFKRQAANFPDIVVGDNKFIIESYIEGEEFAIDVYFNDGEPVIVNIFEHPFSSGKDVSDRLYFTSKAIFDRYLEPFTDYFRRLNNVLKLDHIPVHVEMRVDGDTIVPIEINPLRFTGMCLNDINYYITGKHPLHYYFTGTAPDYAGMWKGKEDKTYFFSILEKPESGSALLDTDYIKSLYSDVLELRLVRNPKLAIQAFVFSRTGDARELDGILTLKL